MACLLSHPSGLWLNISFSKSPSLHLSKTAIPSSIFPIHYPCFFKSSALFNIHFPYISLLYLSHPQHCKLPENMDFYLLFAVLFCVIFRYQKSAWYIAVVNILGSKCSLKKGGVDEFWVALHWALNICSNSKLTEHLRTKHISFTCDYFHVLPQGVPRFYSTSSREISNDISWAWHWGIREC